MYLYFRVGLDNHESKLKDFKFSLLVYIYSLILMLIMQMYLVHNANEQSAAL